MIPIHNYKFHMDDYCPKCKKQTYWEGYCSSCGYSENDAD